MVCHPSHPPKVVEEIVAKLYPEAQMVSAQTLSQAQGAPGAEYRAYLLDSLFGKDVLE